MRGLHFGLGLILPLLVTRLATAIDPYAGNDPLWVLLHEQTVVRELQLSDSQRSAYRRWLNELDVKFFPLRNKSSVEIREGMQQISRDVELNLKKLLEPHQQSRLREILIQHQGNAAFQSPDVSAKLSFSENQKKRLKEISIQADSGIKVLQQESQQSNGNDDFNQRYLNARQDEQRKLLAVLTPEQVSKLKELVGSPFPLSELGRPAFKAPELVQSSEWINSKPPALADLKGKVVIVHFYACGCINCIHNYPSYRKWYDQFPAEKVVMIGIHTPETSSERVSANVRRKAEDEKLRFPVLIDSKQENWNAWGNSMWPAVYIIDRQGYLRDFWAGELKWQGSDGETYLTDRIEELLSESEN